MPRRNKNSNKTSNDNSMSNQIGNGNANNNDNSLSSPANKPNENHKQNFARPKGARVGANAVESSDFYKLITKYFENKDMIIVNLEPESQFILKRFKFPQKYLYEIPDVEEPTVTPPKRSRNASKSATTKKNEFLKPLAFTKFYLIAKFDECIKKWNGGAIKEVKIKKLKNVEVTHDKGKDFPSSVKLDFENCDDATDQNGRMHESILSDQETTINKIKKTCATNRELITISTKNITNEHRMYPLFLNSFGSIISGAAIDSEVNEVSDAGQSKKIGNTDILFQGPTTESGKKATASTRMAIEVKKVNYLVAMDQIMFDGNFFGISHEHINQSLQSTFDLLQTQKIETNHAFDLEFSQSLWKEQHIQKNVVTNEKNAASEKNKISKSLRNFYGNSIGQVILQLQKNDYFIDILDDFCCRLIFIFHKDLNIVFLGFVQNEHYASDENEHENGYQGEVNQLLTYLFCLQLGKELRENGCEFIRIAKKYSNKPWLAEPKQIDEAQG